jgi:hypothetical protein
MSRAKEKDYVDNTLLRDAVLRSGYTIQEIANAAGVKDDTTIRRQLGLAYSQRVKRGEVSYIKASRLPYDRAVVICRAADLYPVDVGL